MISERKMRGWKDEEPFILMTNEQADLVKYYTVGCVGETIL